MDMKMMQRSRFAFGSVVCLCVASSQAFADEILVSDMSTYLESQMPAKIIALDPDMFRSMSDLDCKGFVEHAGLIVETISSGKVSVNDLRPIDEEIGRPTFLHDFVERTMGGEEMTTLSGARIVTQVGDDCAMAIDHVVEKHSE